MWQELKAVFEALDAAPEIRAVVLGGSGNHFSTGIDLEYLYALKQQVDGLSEGRKQEFLHRVIVDLQNSVTAIVGQGMAFTGRRFNGEEARSLGFVNQVHPDRQALDEAAGAMAEELAAKSPLTLRGIKETMNFSRDHGIADGLRYIAVRNAAMLVSKDLEEAVMAFMQKRPPRFED